ncbi:uncharacterized protein LOC142496976 isoform X2 [Ascaphus truei]|uniref:uncharacterized protein LOC142496976 isoform X2 n=1 Tax=Ascaphus truei TaxID=8439 RepID=UPI003F5AC000
MNLYDAFGYRSPKWGNSYLYQSMESDSGILSLNSSASSSDLNGSQSEIGCWPSRYGLFEEALKNELIRSENRRTALAESLKRARDALQHQRNCLQQQDSDILGSKAKFESVLMRQELLASKVSNLQDKKIYRDLVTLNISEMNDNEDQRFPRRSPNDTFTDNSRITALEREINKIKLKIHAPTKSSNNSFGFNLCEENKEYMEEIQEELQQYAQQMADNCSSAQQERDALELQMTSLHSEILHAKVTSKGLEKERLELQSQLLASRNINEKLQLEVSYLTQHRQKLEDAVKEAESEKKALNLQVENLEGEKQSLLSQKELLFAMLKTKRKSRKHNTGQQDERSYGHHQMQKNTFEKLQDKPNMDQHVSGQLGSELGAELQGLPFSDTSSPGRNSRNSNRWERRKGVKNENKGSVKIPKIECQIFPVKMQKEEKPTQKFGSKTKSIQVEKESGLESEENLFEADQPSKSSKRSELNTGHTEIIVACYQHLADLLRKLECLLKSNVRLDQEKDQVVKYLVAILKELEDAKTLSQESRKHVEKLLNEHINLKANCHKRENQITSVIIELKNLRQAYHGIIKHSNDPDDRKLILWISNVQAIKDSLKILESQKEKTESMEDENCILKAKLHCEAFKQQNSKQKSTGIVIETKPLFLCK